MLLPTDFNSMNNIGQTRLINEILEMNKESREFNLVLTPRDAASILEARNEFLQQLARIEMSIDVSKSLIRNFCNSSFITPEDYVATLIELHEIFYHIKNETDDKIGDNELIRVMKDYFENSCGGSLELLKSMLASYSEEFRKTTVVHTLLKEDQNGDFKKSGNKPNE